MHHHDTTLASTLATLCLALVAGATGCVAIDDADTDPRVAPTAAQLSTAPALDLAPLATLELDNGSVVDYYEADPGSILIVETGPRTNRPALAAFDRSTSAADIHRALAPERPVPAALRDTVARAIPRDLDTDRDVADRDTDRTDRGSSLWNNWFSEEFCTVPGSEFSFCLLDQTVSASRSYNDAFFMRSAALGNYGTVRFLFYRYRWYDGWKLLWDQNVNAGYYTWYQFTEGGIDDPDLWTGVVDVSAGEQYDFGGTGIW